LKVFRKIKKFRGESRLSTWIATIAYNTSISYIRRKGNRQELFPGDDEQLLLNEADGWQVQNAVEKQEAKAILLQMIEQLPVQYRTVLTLFHLEEFSYKEIEEITQMPEGTIKSYLSRARKLLKEKLEVLVLNEKTNIFVNYAD